MIPVVLSRTGEFTDPHFISDAVLCTEVLMLFVVVVCHYVLLSHMPYSGATPGLVLMVFDGPSSART